MSSATFAGVERYVIDTATELAARGHRARIVGDAALFTPHLGDSPVELVSAVGAAQVARALTRVRDADLLHVHMTAAELAAVAAWPVNHAPAIATRHFAQVRGSSAPVRMLAPVIRKRLARQLSISQFVASTISEPSTVLYNGVRSTPAVVAEGRVVLVAQRLEREKRTIDVLLAWERARLAERGWELWIAGDGQQRDQLERHARDAGLASVRFLGRRSDLPELRSQCGMQLATADAEPFGLSVVEAMAAGLPVVAADGGAHRETVGACDASLLYPLDDLDACAAIMRRLAASTEERVAVGARLRSYQQQHFSLDSHIDALEAVYAEVAR